MKSCIKNKIKYTGSQPRVAQIILCTLTKRPVNVPFLFIPAILVLWIVISAVPWLGGYLSGQVDLRTAVIIFARTSMVGLVVDLGDRISNTDLVCDRQHLAEVASAFKSLTKECHHLTGNHDVVYLSVAENEKILGTSLQHHSLDRQGWHLAFWNASCELHEGEGFRLEQDDLEWQAADLAATDLLIVVFSHMPVDTGSMVGNYYFERRYAHGEQHRNASLARDLIEKNEKVIAVVSGHVHWNQLHVMDGIPHFSVQSLSETFTTHPHAAGSWAQFNIG